MHDREMLVGTFKDREDAERAYRTAYERGYQDKDLHVMMSDDTRKRHFVNVDKASSDFDKKGNKAMEGTGVGAVAGGAVGATIMGIIAAGTAVAVPGLGLLVAGPLAGALAGAAAGGAAGSIVGALVGAGIPEDRAKEYERNIKDGRILVGVHPRNDADARYFENEWHATRPA